ncbi:hypothetical protein FISHEDRAFT_15032, partial [Fistulina hepatica ATCC 64428]
TIAKLKAEPGKRPVLSAGPVSPELIFDTLAALETYFAEKDITTDEQIIAARGTLQADPIRRDWFAANETAFADMTFPEWKHELIKEVLDPGWDRAMRTEILSARQKTNEGFKNYVHRLQRRAAYLNDSPYSIDNKVLRDAIERMYAAPLRDHIEVEECGDDADTTRFLALPFKDWVAVVHRRDTQLKNKKLEFAAHVAALKRPAASALGEPSRRYNATPRLSTQHATASTASTVTTDRPPQLTPAEKALLTDNKGCYKCRLPFAGHVSRQCTGAFPKREGYKPVSWAQCKDAATKWNASHNAEQQVTPRFPDSLKNVTAAVAPMPIVNTMDYDVGAVFPAASTDALYANLSDGSDDSDYTPSETVRPLHCAAVANPTPSTLPTVPHLVWNAIAFNANSSDIIPLRSLIDHGAPIVMISTHAVNQLQLRRRRLHTPLPVSPAFAASPKDCPVNSVSLNQSPPVSPPESALLLTEYVKLKLYDPSLAYSARTVKAVICPSLCTDVILGLPWLVLNRIVVDAEERSCICKDSGFDLLHPKIPEPPPPPRPQQHTVSCLPGVEVCALRTRVEQLASEERLLQLAVSIKSEYKDVFAPLPHVDQLPSLVQCNIRLRDEKRTIVPRTYACPRKYREAW